MKRFLYFFLQIGVVFLLNAQATTIFEILDLHPEGCSLSASTTTGQMDAAVDASTISPRPIELPEGINTVNELFFQLGSWVETQTEHQPELKEARIVLDEDYTFFREGQLWGLRKKDKTILKPQYDDIELLDTKDGFIAYKGATANFYDMAGKAQFPNDYHGISQAKDGQFIVYTPQGVGLVNAKGEVLLKPEQELIRLFSIQKAPYYYVKNDKQTSFLYAIQTGEQIHYNAQYYDWNFLNERYARIGNRDLIDLQEKKRVFCGLKINIQVLSTERQFLSIALANQANKRYVIRFDGQLISPEPYYEIRNYYPEGYLTAALPKPYQQGGRQKMLFGIIDTLGNWVLPAKYDQFTGTMVAGNYFQTINKKGETSLLNSTGDTLFPFQRHAQFAYNEDRKSLEMYYEDNGQATGLRRHPKTGKLRPINEAVYLTKRPYKGCGDEAYTVVGTGNGEVLLNPSGKQVLEKAYRRIFTSEFDNTFITLEARPQGSSMFGPYRQLRNCDGSVRSFRVDGQAVTNFYGILVIEEDFYFLNHDLESGNFIFSDGSSMYSSFGWRQVTQRLEDHYILSAAGNKMGIITKDGIEVLAPSFEILFFRKDLGMLKAQLTEDNIQWLKPDGTLLLDGKYDKVVDDKAGKFIVSKGNLTGVFNISGQLVIPVAYTKLYYARGFYHATASNGSKYRFDRTGEAVN